MKTIKSFLIFGSLILTLSTYSQDPTIGLLFSGENVSEGYTLFTPERNQSVYLINNCGEKVNEWTFSELPGATCYILENGTLLRAGKDSLEIRDWDNNLLWSYAMNVNDLLQHHDIEPMPNGNILCVITDRYSNSEIIEEGRDPSNVALNFRLDKIVELQPVGTNSANIVWEWKFKDHLIQDIDLTKLNYGTVEDHPELLDLNYDNGEDNDWVHTNAVDYNSDLDQIIISSKHLSEIYIIDHSTTTAEAASHLGGNSNMGGDFLWRWGNPQVYRQSGTQKLFDQHDPKWVESSYPDAGKISVYNNGGDATNTFSSVHLISPEIVNDTYVVENSMFSPLDFSWSWSGSILGNTMQESIKSGTHQLSNGNFIICENSRGQFSEITQEGEVLWVYRNPTEETVSNQFDIITDNMLFRAEKYSADYIGFSGIDLSAQGIIENENSVSDACITASVDEKTLIDMVIINNPIKYNNISFNKSIDAEAIVITDMRGEIVFSQRLFRGHNLEVNLKPAMYILQIYFNSKTETHKIIVH